MDSHKTKKSNIDENIKIAVKKKNLFISNVMKNLFEMLSIINLQFFLKFKMYIIS